MLAGVVRGCNGLSDALFIKDLYALLEERLWGIMELILGVGKPSRRLLE